MRQNIQLAPKKQELQTSHYEIISSLQLQKLKKFALTASLSYDIHITFHARICICCIRKKHNNLNKEEKREDGKKFILMDKI